MTEYEKIVVVVTRPLAWIAFQIGQIILAVALISLVFNYAYRFFIDWNISGATFYITTFLLALIVFVALRRDYIFFRKFEFSKEEIAIFPLFGSPKRYATNEHQFIPVLHKGVNFPERAASLSFSIKHIGGGRTLRNYAWAGFSPEAFQKVSKFYGFTGDVDFKTKDFGRQ